MALSLKFGRNDPRRKTTRLYQLGQKLMKTFERKFGSVMCRELTNCDIQTEAGRKKYAEKNLWETTCRQYIGGVAAAVFDLISDTTTDMPTRKEDS
jgi:hypothetical protein